jgi:hypothetical protein
MTPNVRPLEPWARVVLVAAPLLTVVARTVSVPWDDSHPAKFVQHVAASPIRSDIGATLVILGATLSIPAVLFLARLARTQRARLGWIGGALAVTGCVGIAGVGTKSLAAGQIVRHSPRDTAISLSRHLAVDVHTIDLLTFAGVAGYVLLAMCLYRDRQNPRAIAILIGLGGMATMFTSQGPIRVLILTAAFIALAGQGWLAGLVSRTVPATPKPPTTA